MVAFVVAIFIAVAYPLCPGPDEMPPRMAPEFNDRRWRMTRPVGRSIATGLLQRPQRIQHNIVAAGHDDIGNLDDFLEGFHGLLAVETSRQHLALFQMVTRRNGITDNQDCPGGLRHQQAGSSGANTWQWE